MSDVIRYVDVILSVRVEGTFTYMVPTTFQLSIGQRVIVQFGNRKLYTAIVLKTHNDKPKAYEAKSILGILDEEPLVNEKQLQFWKWISSYYMCNLSDVMNAALPSSFKLASESKVIVHPEFDGVIEELSTDEYAIVDVLLQNEELAVSEVISSLNSSRAAFLILNELIRREVIQIREDLYDKYKEKVIRTIEIARGKESKKLTVKQQRLLSHFTNLCIKFPKKRWTASDLLKNTNIRRGVLDKLVEKGVVKVKSQSISRLLTEYKKIVPSNNLTKAQRQAFQQIKEGFNKAKVCLLHGVTSSGKTEIYIKLIEEQLAKEKQVLYLLPEIALTSQIINRLRKHFGDKVGVSHSHINNSERVEVWKAVQENKKKGLQYRIMLGARSSLFLPFDNLGLIIVDEEHDPSYKQYQPAPRYHARDAANYLAKIHNANLILGSATPSLESYFNSQKGKYKLIELNSRFSNIQLPRIECIDVRKAHLKKQMKAQFSSKLLDVISETLKQEKQVILFQNRRGYAPILSCRSCGFTPTCKQCDVSLTYHKWKNHIKCHYCGYSEDVPMDCPACDSNDFDAKGYGTEQIKESLDSFFPEANIARMDYDTTRRKYAHQEIITEFEQGRIDILVGTQMVAKGLDFDNVAVVGILNADNMLYYPDFRASERAFHLMMQVAGRAGRKGARGNVYLQTYDTQQNVIQLLKSHDFRGFYKEQIVERKTFNYPPFSRIIRITIKHKDKKKLDKFSGQLASQMRKSFGKRVLGPEYPVVSRIRNYFHKDIMLKIEQYASIREAKIILNSINKNLHKQKDFRSARMILDVDPV